MKVTLLASRYDTRFVLFNVNNKLHGFIPFLPILFRNLFINS